MHWALQSLFCICMLHKQFTCWLCTLHKIILAHHDQNCECDYGFCASCGDLESLSISTCMRLMNIMPTFSSLPWVLYSSVWPSGIVWRTSTRFISLFMFTSLIHTHTFVPRFASSLFECEVSHLLSFLYTHKLAQPRRGYIFLYDHDEGQMYACLLKLGPSRRELSNEKISKVLAIACR